jgi:hypothetical protein
MINHHIDTGIEGWYTLTKRKAIDGRVVQQLEFKNVITNVGLNNWFAPIEAGQFIVNGMCIGTGTTAPNITDSSLSTFSRSTVTFSAGNGSSNSTSPPYESRYTFVNRFNAGVLNGNYTEVGAGWYMPTAFNAIISGNSATPPTVLFSRALILDGSGNPTSITVLSDEFLDVSYTVAIRPPTSDVVGTIDISGTNYDYIVRPAEVTNAQYWSTPTTTLRSIPSLSSFPSVITVYDGNIGDITGSPSGLNLGSNNNEAGGGTGVSGYSNNSFQATYSITIPLGQCNLAGGGFRSLRARNAGGCSWQMQFTPNIPKDATKTFNFVWTQSHTRI